MTSPSTGLIYKKNLIKPKPASNLPPKLNADLKKINPSQTQQSQNISIINQNEKSKKTIGVSEAISSEWN